MTSHWASEIYIPLARNFISFASPRNPISAGLVLEQWSLTHVEHRIIHTKGCNSKARRAEAQIRMKIISFVWVEDTEEQKRRRPEGVMGFISCLHKNGLFFYSLVCSSLNWLHSWFAKFHPSEPRFSLLAPMRFGREICVLTADMADEWWEENTRAAKQNVILLLRWRGCLAIKWKTRNLHTHTHNSFHSTFKDWIRALASETRTTMCLEFLIAHC